MNAIIADANGQPKRLIADQIARRIGTEIVDSAKIGTAVEFYTEDFRVIRVY